MLLANENRKERSHEELQKDRQQNRLSRLLISGIACITPLMLLIALYYLLACGSLDNMNMWVQLALISGTFLTFISIYSFLLAGLFRRHSRNDKEGESDGLSERTVGTLANATLRSGGVE